MKKRHVLRYKNILLAITSLIVVAFYFHRPFLYSKGEHYFPFKHFDEMIYLAKVTQIASGNSPDGNCILNHQFDDKKSLYPIYAEKFLASIYKIFSLTPRSFLLLLSLFCPLLILGGLYMLIRSFKLDQSYNIFPVLLAGLLMTGVLFLKPYLIPSDFGVYIFPFERYLNPLLNVIPTIFYFASLVRLLVSERPSLKYVVLTGLFGGVTFYTNAYYYLVNSIVIILFFILSIVLWRNKILSFLYAGIINLLVASPVIYQVLWGPKIEYALEKMWVVGLLLPIKNVAYLTHKGMIFIILSSLLLFIFNKKYKQVSLFILILQSLVYALSNLSVVFNKIFLTLHFQYFNIITFVLFYIIVLEIFKERISGIKIFIRYWNVIPLTLSLLIILMSLNQTLNDKTKLDGMNTIIEKRASLLNLIGKNYSKKIFLAPLDVSSMILAQSNVQLFTDRFMNFCDLHPEELLARNILNLKIYQGENYIINEPCEYYWPWAGFITDEFKKINTNCYRYNDYIQSKLAEFKVSTYQTKLGLNHWSIDYILQDRHAFFDQTLMNQLFQTSIIMENQFWTLYKVNNLVSQ